MTQRLVHFLLVNFGTCNKEAGAGSSLSRPSPGVEYGLPHSPALSLVKPMGHDTILGEVLNHSQCQIL